MTDPGKLLTFDYSALVAEMPYGVFRMTPKGDTPFVYFNPALCALLGGSEKMKAKDYSHLRLSDIFADPRAIKQQIDAVLKKSPGTIPEIEIITASGKKVLCQVTLSASRAETKAGGQEIFIDGVIQDCSWKRRAECDLKESREIFQTVFNNSAIAIIVADGSQRITAWNPFAEKLLGMEKMDLFNKEIRDLYPSSEWGRTLSECFSRKDGGTSTDVETQLYRKDRSVLDVSLSVSYIKDSGGRVCGIIMILRDMTKQKIAEQRIRESENKIRIILDHSAAAITLTDDQERIISWNKYTEGMLGKTKEDLYLQPVSSLYPEAEWKKIRAQEIRKIGSKHHFETQVLKKDGSLLDVDLSVNVLKDENDKIIGSVGIMQDITEQKRVQAMLLKAKIAAEEANSAKSLFLANMSHEVRTPMNTILGLVDLTLDTQLTSEQRDNLTTIKNAGDILLSLLNDILDLSRVEAGKIQLENIELNLSNIVQSVCKGLDVLARNKKLQLVHELDTSIPPVLVGDPVRIRQVLVNLINNAIKFTFQGQVATKVRVLRCQDGICELEFSVKDQGVGIPKDKLESIFEAFTQADASTTRRFGGTGLGLAISKRLVEMMGGRIWAESEEFQGSTFIFTAKLRVMEKLSSGTAVAGEDDPKIVPAGGSHAPSGGAPSSQDPRMIRILLAEDNLVNQKIAMKMLEKRGWFVKGAENGKQVLEYLEQDPFDVILMDAQMPVLDGFEATRLIRQAEQKTGKHIPIIALTAHAMAGDRQKCLDAGMDGYVSKPIDRQKLYEAIESLV